MGIFESIGTWISNNESLLSGVAALAAVIGVIVSALTFAMNRMRKPTGAEQATASRQAADAAVRSDQIPQRKLSFRELVAPSPYPVHYAESDGLRIAYNERGEGEPAIILAPGILSHLHLNANMPGIKETQELLSQRSRLICFDKRGQGLSDPSTQAPSIEERVSDIDAVMNAAGVDAGVLIGVSEAGPICIQYAHDHPERIKGLVLFGTGARFLESTDFPAGLSEASMDGMAKFWGKGVMRDVFLPGLSRDVIDDDTYRAMEKLMAPPHSIKAIMKIMKEMDVRELLPTLTVPTLVIHFAGDLAIPARLGRLLHEAIPNSEHLEVAGCDHSAMSESQEAIEAVWDFCERVR
ncbi:MAG: hypothetical protein Cons2KO_14550 [Congregibacter sp.]